ncbi:MAG: DUF1648 domain-containing protein [Verrucomicrobiia bacterium]
MKKKYYAICGALILVTLIATLIVYPHLPETIPTHWNGHGQADGYGSRSSIFFWPGFMAVILLMFAVVPWLSPKHFKIDTFESTYLYLVLICMSLMFYINALFLWAQWSRHVLIVRAMMGGISLSFALMGNVMGKVRRNFWAGVRTPWTLANERVWNATHRFAAKAMVLAGVAGLIVALASEQFWLWIGIILLGGLSPVLYSLIYYKRLERTGQLET